MNQYSQLDELLKRGQALPSAPDNSKMFAMFNHLSESVNTNFQQVGQDFFKVMVQLQALAKILVDKGLITEEDINDTIQIVAQGLQAQVKAAHVEEEKASRLII